jgi:hypothetical protein
MVDKDLVGRNMKTLKIDFTVVKSVRFFQDGYYPQEVKINWKTTTTSYTINLEKKPDNVKTAKKYLIATTPIVLDEVVTNYPEQDLGKEIKNNFKDNNIYLGNDLNSFPSEKNVLTESSLILNTHIITSEQIRGFYIAPYFNMASITIQWTIIDKNTKEIVYNKEIKSYGFVRYSNTSGMVAADELKKVMASAILDGQQTLIADADFQKLLK